MTSDSENLIDWGAARSITGGDEQLLDEIVELFPSESAAHLEAIRSALEGGDAEALERSAHTLKSGAKMFGARELVALAAELEALGRESDMAAAALALPELERALLRMLDVLRQGRPQR